MIINEFRGKYDFLSNFYSAPVEYDELLYLNNEAAFQSAKVLDIEHRKQFCRLDPSTAKKRGRNVLLRNDWEQVKDEIMCQIVRAKFIQNEDLRERLFATGDAILIEGNTWGDTYWGICRGRGKNMLGKILMKVREEIGKVYYR